MAAEQALCLVVDPRAELAGARYPVENRKKVLVLCLRVPGPPTLLWRGNPCPSPLIPGLLRRFWALISCGLSSNTWTGSGGVGPAGSRGQHEGGRGPRRPYPRRGATARPGRALVGQDAVLVCALARE